MTALIITGSVILLIAALMSLPLIFEIDFRKEAEIRVRLLFFDLFTEKNKRNKKTKKPKVNKKPENAVKTSETRETPETPKPDSEEATGYSDYRENRKASLKLKPPKKKKPEKKKSDLDLDFETIKMLIDGAARPIKKLIKKIKISELYIESVVGGSDAAAAAINFGLQNAAIYSALAWLKTVSNVKVRHIGIQPDFMREDSEFNFYCKIKLKIGTLIVCAVAALWRIMKIKSSKNAPASPRRGGVGKSIRIIMD